MVLETPRRSGRATKLPDRFGQQGFLGLTSEGSWISPSSGSLTGPVTDTPPTGIESVANADLKRSLSPTPLVKIKVRADYIHKLCSANAISSPCSSSLPYTKHSKGQTCRLSSQCGRGSVRPPQREMPQQNGPRRSTLSRIL